MQVKSLLARVLSVFCLLWAFAGSAHAEGYYISGKCLYPSSGNCYGDYSSQRFTDISAALNGSYNVYTSSMVCDKPAAQDYPSTTLVNTGDPNGISVKLPLVYTNCRDSSNPSVLVVGNDPSGARGILHLNENTLWEITRCNPGYSPSKSSTYAPYLCTQDIAATVADDASNEKGPPPNCSECQKAWLRRQAANSEPVGPVVGDPINAANGNEMLAESDYIPASASLVAFGRSYNSGAGPMALYMAPGWSHTYSYRAVFPDDGSTVVMLRPDGSSATFTLAGGVYSGPSYETGTLLGTFASGKVTALKYVRPDGTIEQYAGAGSAAGNLTSITYGQGGVVTLTYSGNLLLKVQDDRGHLLSLAYGGPSGNAVLTKVTLPDNSVVVYGYDTPGRLTSVTYPGSAVRTYQYPAWAVNGQLNSLRYKLTRVVAENGKPVVNVAYDGAGHATASWAGTGNADLTQVSYGSSSATVTDALGVVSQMNFMSVDGTPRAFVTSNVRTCTNGCAGGDLFEYDSRGNVSGLTTKQGLKTCLAYSAPRNLPTLVVEGLQSGTNCSDALASPPGDARVRTYQWHASYAVPMTVTGPQVKTLYNYDTAGRMLLRADLETNDFSGASGASAQTIGASRTTSWTYDAKGSVTSIKAPRSDVNATTTYAYDASENLVSITDPVGLVTTYDNYDANGRPGLVTYPNGLQSSLSYDARGHVTQVVTGGVATTYSYDAAGLLVGTSLPSGVSLSMGYDDANRLIWTQDSLGNRVDRLLDAAGNVTQETVKGNGGAIALSRQAAYDQLSRITSLTKAF